MEYGVNEWFGEAESLATDIGAVITIPRICKYQQPCSNVPADSPSDTARQCTVCSLVYCTHTNRYSSALDTWAVFHTSRMRRHVYVSERTLRLYV